MGLIIISSFIYTIYIYIYEPFWLKLDQVGSSWIARSSIADCKWIARGFPLAILSRPPRLRIRLRLASVAAPVSFVVKRPQGPGEAKTPLLCFVPAWSAEGPGAAKVYSSSRIGSSLFLPGLQRALERRRPWRGIIASLVSSDRVVQLSHVVALSLKVVC